MKVWKIILIFLVLVIINGLFVGNVFADFPGHVNDDGTITVSNPDGSLIHAIGFNGESNEPGYYLGTDCPANSGYGCTYIWVKNGDTWVNNGGCGCGAADGGGCNSCSSCTNSSPDSITLISPANFTTYTTIPSSINFTWHPLCGSWERQYADENQYILKYSYTGSNIPASCKGSWNPTDCINENDFRYQMYLNGSLMVNYYALVYGDNNPAHLKTNYTINSSSFKQNTIYNWYVRADLWDDADPAADRASNSQDWFFSMPAHITGKVFNNGMGASCSTASSAEGVPNAAVTFTSVANWGYPGSYVISAVTDDNGNYSVWLPSAHAYTVTFPDTPYTDLPSYCPGTPLKLLGDGATIVANYGLNYRLDKWWQVKDSDVQASGNIMSSVPVGKKFDLDGDGGFPGIPTYGGGTNLTSTNVSSTGWLANSTSANTKTYNYKYFANLIPSDILTGMNNVDIGDPAGELTSSSAAPDANGYYWYKYDGEKNGGLPLTIPGVDIGTRKVILLVNNADLNITGNINLTDGQGFFMVIAGGNITVDPGVGGGTNPNLEGLYFADGAFSDGAGTTQLHLRGSLTANGGVAMQRDLGDSSDANHSPAELFEYAPDQIMLFPKVFGTRRMSWKEVAP